MRHGKKINHLGRKSAHRQALLSNLASSLIINKRISTTVAKAKALRKYVEPLLTKSKEDTTHSRRTAFSYLQNKDSVQTLFGEVASKIADRPGGYTRIIKLADTRLGDNAEMCFIELVDFNTLYTKEGAVKKSKTRRGRRGKKEEGAETTEAAGAEAQASEEKPEKKSKKAAAGDEPKAQKKATTPKKKKE
jgi:large subunit ribosomal protein L17